MSTCRMTSQCVSWERNQRPASAGLKLEPCLSRTQTGTLPQPDSNWNPASAGLKLEPCLSWTQTGTLPQPDSKLEPCLSWTQTGTLPQLDSNCVPTNSDWIHACFLPGRIPPDLRIWQVSQPSKYGREVSSQPPPLTPPNMAGDHRSVRPHTARQGG